MDTIQAGSVLSEVRHEVPRVYESNSSATLEIALTAHAGSDTSDLDVDTTESPTESLNDEVLGDDDPHSPHRSDSGLDTASSLGHDADHQRLLDMIARGELEYSIEEDAEETDKEDDNEPIEILVEDSLPAEPSQEASQDSEPSSIPSKKRSIPSSPHESVTSPESKKPKLEENPDDAPVVVLPETPAPPIAPITTAMDVDVPNAPCKITEEAHPIDIKSPEVCNSRSASIKSPSRSRSSNSTPITPLGMVTRTRALTASTAGAETVIPEHSHVVPKFMPKAPIRAIEIPVWHLRDTYEQEEDLIAQYQSLKTTKGDAEGLAASQLAIETKFALLWNLPPPVEPVKNAAMQVDDKESESEEEGDSDAHYVERHYKKEMNERLLWEGCAEPRFKPEDLQMTFDEMKTTFLWNTYTSAGNGKLLPKDLWAQNMTHDKRRPHSYYHVSASPKKTAPKHKPTPSAPASLPLVVPKGFVLKLKSATGITILKAGDFTTPNRPPSTPGNHKHGTAKHTSPPKALSAAAANSASTKKPVVKKAGTLSPPSTTSVALAQPQQRPPSNTSHPIHIRLASSSHTAPAPSQTGAPLSSPPVVAPAASVVMKTPQKLVVKFGSKVFGSSPSAEPVKTAAAQVAVSVASTTTSSDVAKPITVPTLSTSISATTSSNTSIHPTQPAANQQAPAAMQPPAPSASLPTGSPT